MGGKTGHVGPERSLKRRFLLPFAVGIAFFAVPMRLSSWESAFFDLFDASFSARTAALGGLHAALADDSTTLFSNCAGFQSVEPQLSISQLTVGLYESAAQIAGELLSGSGDTTSAPRRGTLALMGPLALSYVGRGWGLGVFNTTNVQFYGRGAPSPSAWEVIEETLILVGGRTFRIPLPERWSSTLDLGVSLVGFWAGRTLSYTDIRQAIMGSADLQTLLGNAAFFQRALGASIEFGLRYSFMDRIAVGIAGRNLSFEQIRVFGTFWDFLGGGASAPTYNLLPLDISAGVLFRPPLGCLGRYISDLKLMADYHNIFDFLFYPPGATNPLLHIGVGAELVLLQILSFRVGYYQCQPSFGLGLDLSLFTLNIASFGRETSSEPGGYPVHCFSLGLEFKY
jgi:hypothetical protein